jgi:serine/threonine-protein kinase
MGSVYLARRLATGQTCAVKIILPEAAASERTVRMFLREISVLGQLDHPRIVRFLDQGIDHGQFFFAMEYVETINLAAWLSGRPDAQRRRVFCDLTCQVLEGLEYAHARGFVHRDVKPSNILVSHREGLLQAQLADFGLAKSFQTAGLSGITDEGEIRGTPSFMAPEQVADCRFARPAVDLYGVGASLYYFLANQPPYGLRPRTDLLVALLEQDPTPLTQLCPTVPAGLAEVIHQALSREPDRRFAGAPAMRAALLPYTREG